MKQHIFIAALLALISACASIEIGTAPSDSANIGRPDNKIAAETAALPADTPAGVVWVAQNPQWRSQALATFAEATAYVNKMRSSEKLSATPIAKPQALPHKWVVVLDLDETVLNNVQYQIDLARTGASYSRKSWHEWCEKRAATLVPGAKEFIQHVSASGGLIAFVTNRSDVDQLSTEQNLAALGIVRSRDFRVLITRAAPKGISDKTARYAVVPPLLGTMGYPDTKIIAYIGDNIHDQPNDLDGAAFFCINQGGMYGSPCTDNPLGTN